MRLTWLTSAYGHSLRFSDLKLIGFSLCMVCRVPNDLIHNQMSTSFLNGPSTGAELWLSEPLLAKQPGTAQFFDDSPGPHNLVYPLVKKHGLLEKSAIFRWFSDKHPTCTTQKLLAKGAPKQYPILGRPQLREDITAKGGRDPMYVAWPSRPLLPNEQCPKYLVDAYTS